MRNKTKFAFLSLVISTVLIAVACQKPASSQPNSQASSDSTFISSETINSSENTTSANSSSENNKSSVVINSSSNISSSPVAGSSSQTPISSSIEPISSETPISSSTEIPSSVIEVTYTVTFKVGETVVQTDVVHEGEIVTYNGEEPVKEGDANSPQYRFVGWDRDLSEPITGDTVINAVFAAYASELVIDDFESYEDSPSMIDEGWTALTYASGGWTDNTKAAISLSTNATDGKQALRFDAWANQSDYKFVKNFKENEFTKSANALQFKLKLPKHINKVKVLLHAAVNIGGTPQAPYFSYTLNPIPSGEYIAYTIPLADDGWALYNEMGKSIKACADYLGVQEDDILRYLTKIEFYVNGNDGDHGWPYIAFCDTIQFVTLANPAYVAAETIDLYDVYTGTLADDHIVRIDINEDKSATAKVIDLEEPQEIPGNVVVNDKEITFTSADGGASLVYTGRLTDGGKNINFISSSGAFKTATDDMNLGAVQVVDNFEQYEEDGTAYYFYQKDMNQRSGARGAYYSEYFAGGSDHTDWGGDGWSLLKGNGDQLKLKQDANAHTGNQYLCLKNSAGNAIRYMQWGLFDGSSDKNSFRGTTFSFWARTNGVVPAIKANLYWQTTPRNATKDSYVASYTFANSISLSQWTHYEIALNPMLEYYGFYILLEKTGGAESYLYIDDVEVYNANPYAKFEVPPQPKMPELINGMTYLAQVDNYVNAKLTVKNDGVVNLSIPAYEFSQDGTYTCEDGEATISVAGVTYVATVSEDEKTLTFKSVDGQASLAAMFTNVNFNMVDYADNAETYADSGIMYYQSNKNEDGISGARGAYFCEYAYNGTSTPVSGSGWILMGGSGDQLSLDTQNAYDGTKSLKMKKSSAGEMRYYQWNLYKGDGEGHTGVNNFSIALKNPNSTETPLELRVYKTPKVTPETHDDGFYVGKQITLAVNQDWTVYNIELDPNETYYGYAIFLPKASGQAFINVDCAYYTNVAIDPNLYYNIKKNDVLTCAEVGASITFGNPGQAIYNDAAAGLNNVACTYTMYMNGYTQMMVLKINDITLTGSYSMLPNRKACFSVMEMTGGTLGELLINDSFTN